MMRFLRTWAIPQAKRSPALASRFAVMNAPAGDASQGRKGAFRHRAWTESRSTMGSTPNTVQRRQGEPRTRRARSPGLLLITRTVRAAPDGYPVRVRHPETDHLIHSRLGPWGQPGSEEGNVTTTLARAPGR